MAILLVGNCCIGGILVLGYSIPFCFVMLDAFHLAGASGTSCKRTSCCLDYWVFCLMLGGVNSLECQLAAGKCVACLLEPGCVNSPVCVLGKGQNCFESVLGGVNNFDRFLELCGMNILGFLLSGVNGNFLELG